MTQSLVYKLEINKGNKDIAFEIYSNEIIIEIYDGDRVINFQLTKDELKDLTNFINFVQIK